MSPRLPTDDQSHPNGQPAGGTPAGDEQSWLGSPGAPSTPRVFPILAGRVRGVAVVGDLDSPTVALLDAAVVGVCRAGPVSLDPETKPGFFLNLRDVTYLDASGLFLLGRIHEQIDGSGNDLRVAAPLPAEPRRVLLLAVTRGLLPPVFSPWSTLPTRQAAGPGGVRLATARG